MILIAQNWKVREINVSFIKFILIILQIVNFRGTIISGLTYYHSMNFSHNNQYIPQSNLKYSNIILNAQSN